MYGAAAMTPTHELATLLRPAGGGLHLVSSGLAEQKALQRQVYGVSTEAEVRAEFERRLELLPKARGFVLGVPSDVGAGFQRGANLGPQAMRSGLLARHSDWNRRLESMGVVDVGDVFVIPQLLHDSMHSDSQLRASRLAIYPSVPEAERERLPVSPLSIEERALDLILQLAPHAKPLILGGDHSVAWPVASALSRVHPQGTWGVVQPDAHTDLLESRLGIAYCFGTWSHHANELLGRKGRMVQVGIRASGRDQAHWESTRGVRQFWAKDCLADLDGAVEAIVRHVESLGVKGIYLSNDIDGTDSQWADATGTPESGGLPPSFFLKLIRELGSRVGILAGDLVELAPRLAPDGGAKTVSLACDYVEATLEAMFPRG